MSPFTLRSPAGQVNPTAGAPAARRCRAAVALSLACEKQAREPSNPLATRERAAVEAGQHLAAAWGFLTSWTVEAGPSEATAAAASFIGAINRRLPILAAMLRAEAGLPLSCDGDAREAALWPASLTKKPVARPARLPTSPPPTTTRPRASP